MITEGVVATIMAEPRDFFTSLCSDSKCGILHSVAEHALDCASKQYTPTGAARANTEKEIVNELNRRSIPYNWPRPPGASKMHCPDIVIHFSSTLPITLEISIRRSPGGLPYITQPSKYDQKIAMGCTHWLFLDITTSSSYLMEMVPSAPSPSTAAACENMLIDKKNLLSGPGTPSSATKKPKSRSRVGTRAKSKPPTHMSQSHVMFPLINRPPLRPIPNPSQPLVDPPDFERRMLDHLPTLRDELLKSLTDPSGVSMPGPPILLVSDLKRPLKEEFSNDEDTSTPNFPAAEHPELTYLLRYFSIVECVPSPFTKTGCALWGRGNDLFQSLSKWIKDLEESVANGDALMAITGGHDLYRSEHWTGMGTDFWGEPNPLNPEEEYKHDESMALALGFKESDHPDVTPTLTTLAKELMARFPLLARKDGYTGLFPPHVLPASLTTTGISEIVPISDLLSIKNPLLRASPAVQGNYATSRKPCSDYNGPPRNQPNPWAVSLSDALVHLFGLPTEMYDTTRSLCADAWPINHVLKVLKTLQAQLTPNDATTKTRVFQSMLSTWRYIPPTAGNSFDKALRIANQAMVDEGVPELEHIAMTQRLRTEGIILLDLGKMRASAIDYLAARYCLRRFIAHITGDDSPLVEDEIERDLKYRGQDIVNHALEFLGISFFSSAMKAMLATGIDAHGRRAREPRNGAEFDTILDGLAMGHAVNLLTRMATSVGATHLSPGRILAVLANGTKEVTCTINGEVINGPPMWAIMQAIAASDPTGVKENLARWHQALRRTESSDDTWLLAGIINDINGMRENPWMFFKNR